MPRKFKFCLRCRRTIAENEVERGLFVQTPNGMLCATCAQQLDEETEAAKQLAAAQAPVPADPPVAAEPAVVAPIEEKPAPVPPAEPPAPVALDPPAPTAGTPAADPQSGGPEPPAELLDDIREHVEAIHRTLVFEKSSPWNVLATIAQCLAFGMLILGAINWADNPMHLLLVALIFQVMALTFFVRAK
ncbi:MAG: hypothetical protein ABSA67_14010 [Candidatus Brocadiia bacterium]|jgi:hypothetical protein